MKTSPLMSMWGSGEAPAGRESRSPSPPPAQVKEEKYDSNITMEQDPAAEGVSPPRTDLYSDINNDTVSKS